MTRYVYIAQSLDGYIAGKDGDLVWLNNTPNPENNDFGFSEFISHIDAIVMGRNTFETVQTFGAWPYSKPVYVISSSLKELHPDYSGKAELLNLKPAEIINHLGKMNLKNLYIDGGKLIQSFLAEDLIDEMIITTLPVLLGEGVPLFGKLQSHMHFTHMKTEVLLESLVKTHFVRGKRS